MRSVQLCLCREHGLGGREVPPPSQGWFLSCCKPVFPLGGESGSPIPRGTLAEAVKGHV